MPVRGISPLGREKRNAITVQQEGADISIKLLTKALTDAGVELPQQRNFTRQTLQAFAKR
jgi:hypothetical protein